MSFARVPALFFLFVSVAVLGGCGAVAMLSDPCVRADGQVADGCVPREPPGGDRVAGSAAFDATGGPGERLARRVVGDADTRVPSDPVDPEDPDEPAPVLGDDAQVGAATTCTGQDGAPLPAATACLVPTECGAPGTCDGAGVCHAPAVCVDERFPACDAAGCACVTGSCGAGRCVTMTGVCVFDFEFPVQTRQDDALQSLSSPDLVDDDERLEIDAETTAWFRFSNAFLPRAGVLEEAHLLLFNDGRDDRGHAFDGRVRFERAANALPLALLPPLLRGAWTGARAWSVDVTPKTWMESPDLSDLLEEVRAEGGLEEPSGNAVLVQFTLDALPTLFGLSNEVWALSSTGSHPSCAALGCAPRLVGSYRERWSARSSGAY